MGEMYTTQPLTAEDAERIREHLNRSQREEQEWLTARLHHALHGVWEGPDECPVCITEALDRQIEQASK